MLKLTRMPVGAQHDYLDICVLTVKGCLSRRHGTGNKINHAP